MRAARLTLAALIAVGLAACGTTISAVNARPDAYYQQRVDLYGRIERRQELPGEILLEVADKRGGRILVRAAAPVDAMVGDWVTVKGILVPEARVADRVLYDVVTADSVSVTHAPRIPDFM
jgi:hypothetical protein